VQAKLPFSDRREFDDVQRGFIATIPGDDPNKYAFLDKEAPPTVNPSLWRQAQLDVPNGLFKVTDGVYQVRNFSVSNMTIVEGKTGIIIVDTLASPGAAREALTLYYANRPKKPIKAIVYTHSHGDHYGGASGLIAPEDAVSGKVVVLAPLGFMDALITESTIATNLTARRGQFQFGGALPVNERGTIDYGEGKSGSRGTNLTPKFIPPTVTIEKPIESKTIDGVTFVFQLALNTEAPSEMMLYLPQSHVLDVAELATHTLHNLLPLRGTVVRDGKAWATSLNQALDRFGADVQILIDQHQWPVWGNDRVREKLANNRDLYEYVHDQTIRMMNEGMGPAEIADAMTMPPGLEGYWPARGYYGTLSHDSRAVYQKYVGWYDGNPVNLNRLPRVDEAKKYLEYMGGPTAVITKAREDFKNGNYRWVATVMDQMVFADPTNKEARELAADAYEQLGYLAESAVWRNAYLLATQELRNGVKAGSQPSPAISADMLGAMTAMRVFDYLGTRVDGAKATQTIVIAWHLTDTQEAFTSTLEHGALTTSQIKAPAGTASIDTTKAVLSEMILGKTTLTEAEQQGRLTVTGDRNAVVRFWATLVTFQSGIPLVAPS
jgi:alkyl sulfatase BDS1-like metallo-beta-lactamase superfamily hydrolase